MMAFSIIYLRCFGLVGGPTAIIRSVPFNSLFEMLR